MDKHIRDLKKPSNPTSAIFSNVETQNQTMIEDKLEKERKTVTQNNVPWNKLSRVAKLQKLAEYTNQYLLKEELSMDLSNDLRKYFTDCLSRKRLQNSKDVIYDKITGHITSIPSLAFNKKNNKFTLKSADRKSLINTTPNNQAPIVEETPTPKVAKTKKVRQPEENKKL